MNNKNKNTTKHYLQQISFSFKEVFINRICLNRKVISLFFVNQLDKVLSINLARCKCLTRNQKIY